MEISEELLQNIRDWMLELLGDNEWRRNTIPKNDIYITELERDIEQVNLILGVGKSKSTS